jgi:hypothetical protein
MARVFDIRITTPSEGTRREVPLLTTSDWDNLKNLLYSLLVAPTSVDFINIVITPLEMDD